MPSTPSQPTVAIAGGGLAGLAAACALSDTGFRVTLFEKRPFLGGRASSYEHPGTGEVVDNCQHVLFRVCTNLVKFYEHIGVADQIRWFDQMNFVEPGGRVSVMKSSPLPAPLHTAPSFLHFPFLSSADKLAITRALVPLTLKVQADNGQTFQQWLDAHGQTKNAVGRFWHPILISALSEELDRISVSAAAQVVRESMKTPAARHMGVPTLPLTDLYNAAGDYVRSHGGTLHFRCPMESFAADASQVRARMRGNNSATADEVFDYLVLALPFDALESLLPSGAESSPLREQISHFENSPITGIHLWFDRQISDLDHAVLLDRTIQWMFHKSRLQPMRVQSENGSGSGSYIELVVSSSKTLIDKSRAECELSQIHRDQRGERDLLAASRHRRPPAHSSHSLAARVPRWRLDGHRLACHHGRRRPQRISCGRDRGRRLRNQRDAVPLSRHACQRLNAALREVGFPILPRSGGM